MKNENIRNFKIEETLYLSDIICHVLNLSQDRCLEYLVFGNLSQLVTKYNYILQNKESIPSCVSLESFLAEALNIPQENIIEICEEAKQVLFQAIREGKDLVSIEKYKNLIEKMREHLEIKYTQGEFKILGDWQGYETKVIMTMVEAEKLFTNFKKKAQTGSNKDTLRRKATKEAFEKIAKTITSTTKEADKTRGKILALVKEEAGDKFHLTQFEECKKAQPSTLKKRRGRPKDE